MIVLMESAARFLGRKGYAYPKYKPPKDRWKSCAGHKKSKGPLIRFCGACVWFCQDCQWTMCVGCARECEFSDNYDFEQDPLRMVRRFQNVVREEEENEGESEAEAEANAEAAAEELK